VNKLENRSGNGRWLKGKTGNAARCPTNARTRIPGELLPNPATVLETHGESILGRLAVIDSSGLTQTNRLDN
jgi:hypothetical protein